jgi:hypothetical protein
MLNPNKQRDTCHAREAHGATGVRYEGPRARQLDSKTLNMALPYTTAPESRNSSGLRAQLRGLQKFSIAEGGSMRVCKPSRCAERAEFSILLVLRILHGEDPRARIWRR